MAGQEERRRVSLLLRRAGFGNTRAERERFIALGFDEALDELLHPERVSENFDQLLESMEGHLLDLQNIEDVQTWWLFRMGRTRRQLQEKLTLFWHGHFAVSNAKVANPLYMHRHLDVLRDNAMGNFRDMLLAVSRDPAMLVWLDNGTNRKAAPNENYARELLELYTLGLGQYTEGDVKGAARAFTGWNLRDGEFYFNKNQHDPGPISFMGRTGALDGSDIIEAIVGHEATARRLSRRLFAFFAYPNPAPEIIAPLAERYLSSGFDIRETVGAILRSDAFYSDESRYGHIKSPVEYVVGSVRSTGAQARERNLVASLRDMGQDILNPPNVAGWAGGRAWINPSTLLARFNFANRLSSARGQPNDTGNVRIGEVLPPIDPKAPTPPDTLLASIGELLDDVDLSAETRAALLRYLKAPLVYPAVVSGAPTEDQTRFAMEARLRGAIHLAMTSADYQTA